MANESPAAVLVDSSGNEVTITLDGADYKVETLTEVTAALPAGTNNIGDVDVVSSALPTGAATEATLSAAEVTLDRIADTDGIKKITDPLPAGTNNIGDVDVVSSALPTGAATEATLATLLTEAEFETRIPVNGQAAMAASVPVVIASNQAEYPVSQGTAAALSAPWPSRLTDGSGNAVDVTLDGTDGMYRLNIIGKVSISPPTAPPATTAVTIVSDTPLDMTGTEEDSFLIPNGETFTLTTVVVGAEGDTSERGSRVDIIYDDSGTERLIAREYVAGFTITITPDTNIARDGTSLDGNGTDTYIIVRRIRLSGGSQEVDAVAKGYY